MESILESPDFLAPNNVELDSNKDAARWKEGCLKGPFSAVMVRSARVGSYDCVPMDRLLLSAEGISLKIPVMEKNGQPSTTESINIAIPTKHMLDVQAHFSRSLSVLFFRTAPSVSRNVSKALGLRKGSNVPYWDQLSEEESQKRLTLLAYNLNETSENAIKQAFSSSGIYIEINPVTANDILLKSSPQNPSLLGNALVTVAVSKDREQIVQSELNMELREFLAKGYFLFCKAVEKGDFTMAELLLTSYRVDVNDRNANGFKKTVLHLAIERRNIDHILWLLNEAKADLEIADDKGSRAIHYAVKWSDPKILEMLIAKGAQLDSRDHLGRTALHLAVNFEASECLRLLIHHGCHVNIQDFIGNTALHDAIRSAKAHDFIRILASCDRINWKLCNREGFNVLRLLLSLQKTDLKVMELILENADMDLFFDLEPRSFSTFLHHTCTRRNTEAVTLFLEHQKRISGDGCQLQKLLDAKNSSGWTALLISCSLKDYPMIELLTNYGADVKSPYLNLPDRSTPIILLAYRISKTDSIKSQELPQSVSQYLELFKEEPALTIIAYLIDKGCPWKTVTRVGRTASDILLANGFSKEAIRVLDRIATKREKITSGAVCCFGQILCDQPALYQVSCPHKATFSACVNCFPLAHKKQKCGCAEEDISSLPGVKVEITQMNELGQAAVKRKLEEDVEIIAEINRERLHRSRRI